MYIEPCCIDKQLPALIRRSQGGFCFFQTNGDCDLKKLLDSVSHMASGVGGHVLVLTVPEVDITMLRTLAYYFRRGWTRALLLLTCAVQTELVQTELADYIDHIHYAADPLIIDGQLAILSALTVPVVRQAHQPDTVPEPAALDQRSLATEGTQEGLIIQGAMLSQPDFSLSLYSAWLGTDRDIIRSAIDPAIAKLKAKPQIDHSQHPEVARILERFRQAR